MNFVKMNNLIDAYLSWIFPPFVKGGEARPPQWLCYGGWRGLANSIIIKSLLIPLFQKRGKPESILFTDVDIYVLLSQ
jgi:hypothetical protein